MTIRLRREQVPNGRATGSHSNLEFRDLVNKDSAIYIKTEKLVYHRPNTVLRNFLWFSPAVLKRDDNWVSYFQKGYSSADELNISTEKFKYTKSAIVRGPHQQLNMIHVDF